MGNTLLNYSKISVQKAKLYPTKAELNHLEEIKKKFNLKENTLTGHIPAKPYRRHKET